MNTEAAMDTASSPEIEKFRDGQERNETKLRYHRNQFNPLSHEEQGSKPQYLCPGCCA
jgi:hypothetical protein